MGQWASHDVLIMYRTIFALQAFMYEISCRFEVLTEVKVVRILCWDPKVNAGVPVKTLVADAALLGVRCVQDMSDSKLMQCLSVLCYGPGKHTKRKRLQGIKKEINETAPWNITMHFNRLPKRINFSLAGLMQRTLHTQDTHTFPMYRLGQTSSTGVSSRELESKMSSSSLMSTRSCRWLLPDILPRHRELLLQQTPTLLLLCCCLRPLSLHRHTLQQLSERHEQVAVWMPPASKISSLCSVSSLWLDVVIQHCCCIDCSVPRCQRDCLSFTTEVTSGEDEGRGGDEHSPLVYTYSKWYKWRQCCMVWMRTSAH